MFTASLRNKRVNQLFGLLLLLSVTMVVMDLTIPTMQRTRARLSSVVAPVYWLQAQPRMLAKYISGWVSQQSEWLTKERRWLLEKDALQVFALQITALRQENQRLTDLLLMPPNQNIGQRIGARIITEPDAKQLIRVSQGENAGIKPDMSVIYARGIFGTVVSVSKQSSVVMPIFHPRHALPIKIQRNGYRAVALGSGQDGLLKLQHVPKTVDLSPGDVVLSSGAGGRFPKGLPVGTILTVEAESSAAFVEVTVLLPHRIDSIEYVSILSMQGAISNDSL